MNYLNNKWEIFRTAVELGTSAAALFGIGIWATAAATAERGYRAAGSEYLLAIGAAVLVGIITHKIMNHVGGRINERIAADYEARRQEEIRKANKGRMFTIKAVREHRSSFAMYSVGED